MEEVLMKMKVNFAATGNMNFFLIHKQIGQNQWKPIYKSELQGSKKGFTEWNLVNVLASDMAGEADVEREVRIDFYISQKSGNHKHCGMVSLTLAQLKENTTEFPLTDKKGKALKE